MYRALALVLALLAPVPSGAATLGTFTYDYGNGVGTNGARNPGGTNAFASGDTLFINDTLLSPFGPYFTDSFDISSLAGAVIESVVLTITYASAATGFPSEAWFLEIYGNDPLSQADDARLALGDPNPTGADTGILEVSLGANSAPFAAILSSLTVNFGFDEVSSGFDAFSLFDATLTVNGTAAVPLPAPGLLLLLGLGGLGAAARRRAPPKPLTA